MSRLALLLAVLVALAAAPAAFAAIAVVAMRGIVQAVGVRSLELRTLDGAILSIRIGLRTRVVVDGRRATLDDVQRGFVAAVDLDDDDLAREVQAYSGTTAAAPPQAPTARGGKADRGPDRRGKGRNRGHRSARGDDTR